MWGLGKTKATGGLYGSRIKKTTGDLWGSLVECLTVYAKDDLRFMLPCEVEITALAQTVQCNRETDLEAFLDEHQEPVTDYDEGMVRRLIERITVFEDHLEFEFKCGLETEVQM